MLRVFFIYFLFCKIAGCKPAIWVNRSPQQVFFKDFHHRNIAVQCITAFCRTPLFTEHFSIGAFCCNWTFIFLTYVCLIVQDDLFTLTWLSNIFPTLLTESLLLLNLPIGAKMIYRAAQRLVFFPKDYAMIGVVYVRMPKYFTIMPKKNISAENICSLLSKLLLQTLQVHRIELHLVFFFKVYNMYFTLHLRVPNFPHSAKLSQEIYLKIKLRKFPQKCPTLKKIVISNPVFLLHCMKKFEMKLKS